MFYIYILNLDTIRFIVIVNDNDVVHCFTHAGNIPKSKVGINNENDKN
jgi:hypothetical protein